MTYEEACHRWVWTQPGLSKHFGGTHQPTGSVDFDLATDGYESSGYYAVMDVTARCSCGSSITESRMHDMGDLIRQIVAIATSDA